MRDDGRGRERRRGLVVNVTFDLVAMRVATGLGVCNDIGWSNVSDCCCYCY